jgi:hypothetical protein
MSPRSYFDDVATKWLKQRSLRLMSWLPRYPSWRQGFAAA